MSVQCSKRSAEASQCRYLCDRQQFQNAFQGCDDRLSGEGYSVDVGVAGVYETAADGKRKKISCQCH